MATEIEVRKEELSVTELVSSVYDKILQKYPEFKLRPTIQFESEVADDGDYHSWGRNRKGFMIYDDAAIFEVGERKWIMALAKRKEGYAASDFSCDLKIFPALYPVEISERYNSRVNDALRDRRYFQDSVLVGTTYGGLLKLDYPVKDWTPIHSEIIKSLEEIYPNLVTKNPDFDRGYLKLAALGAPLSWAVKSQLKYKPEASDFIFNAVSGVLEAYNK